MAWGRILHGLMGLGAYALGKRLEGMFSKKHRGFGLITEGSMEDLRHFYAKRCDRRIQLHMREAKSFLATSAQYARECKRAEALAALRGADHHFRSAEAQAEQCAVQKKGMSPERWNKLWEGYTRQANALAKRITGPCRKHK